MEQQGLDFATEQQKIFTVSELTKLVRGLLEGRFSEVWVSGEISNFRSPASGHYYFTLKDETAQLSSVMFRGLNAKLPFKLEDGLEVVCRGRLTVYESRGQYQIVVDYCEPKGLGALQLAFEQLKKKLQTEGLFDPAHKKKLPFLPRKIGIVTSPTGAAIRDILNILGRRLPGVEILVVPVKVQGEGSADEIAQAIGLLNKQKDMDLMIVGRGGGSLEDLWAFNEEVVARAIFASRIPVISAVGHEIDFTIADFVADVRAPTPSAAAELAVPNRDDLLASIVDMKRRLFRCPTRRFPDFLQRLDDLNTRLLFGWQVGWERKEQQLKKLVSNLHHLSPLHILAKGYSVVQKLGSHKPVRSMKELKKGDDLNITLHEGFCQAKVI